MRRSRSRGRFRRGDENVDVEAVYEVLERLYSIIEDVIYLSVLGPRGEEIHRLGDAPAPAKKLAQTMAATLSSSMLATSTGSARCALTITDGQTILFYLAGGMMLVVIGPAHWNVALIGRKIDAYVERLDAASGD